MSFNIRPHQVQIIIILTHSFSGSFHAAAVLAFVAKAVNALQRLDLQMFLSEDREGYCMMTMHNRLDLQSIQTINSCKSSA